MSILRYNYLKQDQLKRLETYKYASIDTSPLSTYVMHPFWNFIVEYVPMSIAPNVLTLAGFACTITNALLLTYYDYDYYASSDTHPQYIPIPSFIWLVCAINFFLAHTLDGIDGKQARRTKCTGPVGELMDHGVDSWTAMFVPLYVYSLFGRTDWSFGPHRMLVVCWSVFFTFYFTHWEKYMTGVLYLPWTYDVSQIVLLICSLTTFSSGHTIWKKYFLNIGPYSVIFEYILYASVFLTMPLPIYNVYKTCKAGKTQYRTTNEISRPFGPLLHLCIVSIFWAQYSSSDVLSTDPRIFLYTVGTIFSNISCRLIVCQMSKTRCQLINGFVLIYTATALGVVYLPSLAVYELQILRLLAVLITLGHVHYGVNVIQQMCNHFGIRCLSTKRKEINGAKYNLLEVNQNPAKR